MTPANEIAFPAYDTSYARLPAALHAQVWPYGASAPRLIVRNQAVMEVLGFDAAAMTPTQAASIFSGNVTAPGSQPLAMAYAGHQFGGFNPQLGDGRALLLGEVIGRDGRRYDIQLKGSGQTPFSRRGDGRAALGPVLREYALSEAMAALGVPTTRALAAVSTGDMVLRDRVLPGGMVTRVASSHLRVGTFEYAARLADGQALRELVDYALWRHPTGDDVDGPPALRLLHGVVQRQAELVARWMGIGFIHGVMNTDNCSISGETIDYGPCAFMDGYHPARVYSSIDHQGRYAFANQPAVAQWNMAVLAQALLRLIDPDEGLALTHAQGAVDGFASAFANAYDGVMRAKLGLLDADDNDSTLVQQLLSIMQEHEADLTNTFRALNGALEGDGSVLLGHLGRDGAAWIERWQARLAQDGLQEERMVKRQAMMHRANPAIIARNHRVEAMIVAGLEGDFAPFHAVVAALAHPFDVAPAGSEAALLAGPPQSHEIVHATFCGT